MHILYGVICSKVIILDLITFNIDEKPKDEFLLIK